MSSGPVLQRLNIHTFKHALVNGKTQLEVLIEHASIVNWTIHGLSSNPAITPKLVLETKNKPWKKHTKVWAFISMSLMKKVHTQWVHVTYAPGSKKAVEIIKNLELINFSFIINNLKKY